MAWTYHVGVPLDHKLDAGFFAAAAVDDCIYVFAYCDKGREYIIEVLIFNVKTSTWNMVVPTSGTKPRGWRQFTPRRGMTSGPRNKEPSFALAHRSTVYMCFGTLTSFNGYDVFAFDTKSLSWSCKRASGDVPLHALRCACVFEDEVYLCVEYRRQGRQSLYALDLRIMRWRRVSEGMWGPEHSAEIIFPFGTRIYVLLRWALFQRNYDHDIAFFDTVTGTWEWQTPSGRKPFAEPDWTAFAHRDGLYVMLHDMDMASTDVKERWSGEERRLILKYSVTYDTWEQVKFSGVPPQPALDSVCIVGNLGFFVSSVEKMIYVLDFLPSLRSLCMSAVYNYRLDVTNLPHILRKEMSHFPLANHVPM